MTSTLTSCPVFIAGQWRALSGVATFAGLQSFHGRCHRRVSPRNAALVDEAVQAAHAAFRRGVDTPAVERARVFFRYPPARRTEFRQTLPDRFARTRQDARGGARQHLPRAPKTSSTPAAFLHCFSATRSRTSARGVDARRSTKPLGVCVGITPFNFPAMVPLWMFPLALGVREYLRP